RDVHTSHCEQRDYPFRRRFAGRMFVTTAYRWSLLIASAVSICPDGLHVYVGAFQGNAITTFSRDTSTGLLTWQSEVVQGQAGTTHMLQGHQRDLNYSQSRCGV